MSRRTLKPEDRKTTQRPDKPQTARAKDSEKEPVFEKQWENAPKTKDQKTKISELISKLGPLPLDQGHEAYCAEQELIGIGKPAVPSLIEALENGEWLVQMRATKILGEIGDISAAPALINIVIKKPTELKTVSEWDLWDSAANALRKITNGKH